MIESDNCRLQPVEARMEISRIALAPETDPSTRVFAYREIVQFCLTQEARRLAGGGDSAETLGAVAVDRCRDQIASRITAQYRADSAAGGRPPPMSERTGRETTVEAWVYEEANRFARRAVVEARQWNCRPLP